MKVRYITIAVVLFIVFFIFSSFNATKDPVSDNQFVAQLQDQVPKLMSDTHTPGVAVALIHHGQVEKILTFGFADREKRIPITRDTLFNAASLSKSITAWGVLKLVEQQKLDLDQPVERYISRWHLPDSSFSKSDVTIRRLLSHTAGLSLHGYNGYPPDTTLPTLEQSLSGQNNGSGELRIINTPGSRYMYSGGGYTLLQLAIAESTHDIFTGFM